MKKTKNQSEDDELQEKPFKLNEFDYTNKEEKQLKRKPTPRPNGDGMGSGLYGLDEFDLSS